MLLTGRRVSAQEALDWGLVGRLVEPGTALKEALELAERVAATGYRASSCEDIARLAERSLAAKWEGSRGELEFLSEFCADEGNRPRVREVFDNWFAIAERSFGRPGSAGDERAVALGLRTSSAGDTAEEFRSRVGEFAGDCGLQ